MSPVFCHRFWGNALLLATALFALPRTAGARQQAQRVLVGLKPAGAARGMAAPGVRALDLAGQARAAAELEARGVRIRRQYRMLPVIAAVVEPGRIPELLAHPNVEYVEPDRLYQLLEPIPRLGSAVLGAKAAGSRMLKTGSRSAHRVATLAQSIPWGITSVGASDAWALTSPEARGAGVTVGIVDTGGDFDHEDLVFTGGFNAVNGSTAAADWDDNIPECGGHGTHVAGTVGARDNSVGVVGVAPEASLYALKVFEPVVLDGSTQCLAYESSIVSALEWAAANGLQVINMSFGSSDPSTTEENALGAAAAAGVHLVAAAGNAASAVLYPAAYPTVIAVAAMDINNARASFSNFGPEIEAAAPGVSVLSTLPGNSYGQYSGTSMASPHVAGLVALLVAHDAALSRDAARTLLHDGAVDLGAAGWDSFYGYGRASAVNAVGLMLGLAKTLRASAGGKGLVTSSPDGLRCDARSSGSCATWGTFTTGSDVTLSPMAASGWRFSTWGGDGAACGSTGTCTVRLDGTRNVSASFTQASFLLTVRVTGNGTVTSSPAGIAAPADSTETYLSGTAVRLSATPDSGWTFDRWGGDGASCGTGTSCTVTMDTTRTATATFVRTATLTVRVSGQGTVTGTPAGINAPADSGETYRAGTSVTLTAQPSAGWGFDGWRDGGAACGQTSSCTITLDSNLVVSAGFAQLAFPMTVRVAGSGRVTSTPAGIDAPSDSTESFPRGTPVTLTENPAGGWQLASWGADGSACGTTATCLVAMDTARLVTAEFAEIRYRVSVRLLGNGRVTSDPAGIDAPGDSSESYPERTQVTLTARPDSGWEFVRWGEDGIGCGSAAQCVQRLDRDRTVSAEFVQAFQLTVAVAGQGTVTSDPAGIQAPADSTESYPTGTRVTLTAAVDSGWTFLTWEPDRPSAADCGSDLTCLVVMDGDRRVAATLGQLARLTVTITGQGRVVSDPSGIDAPADSAGDYLRGTTVGLAARPAAGWVFEEWSEGAAACAGDTTCAMRLDSNTTAAARFVPALVWDDSTVSPAVMGAPFADTLHASGGTGEYRWTGISGALPPGVTLDSAGVLTGVPEATGQFAARVRVSAGRQRVERTVVATVAAPALALDAVVKQLLLEEPRLTPEELTYLDLLGNRNGQFDVGDFLAWIENSGVAVDAATLQRIRQRRP